MGKNKLIPVEDLMIMSLKVLPTHSKDICILMEDSDRPKTSENQQRNRDCDH